VLTRRKPQRKKNYGQLIKKLPPERAFDFESVGSFYPLEMFCFDCKKQRARDGASFLFASTHLIRVQKIQRMFQIFLVFAG
jgi:hypothetical protein